MGKGFWERPWVRHLAVAVGYGVLAAALRELSVSYWMIADGLRLSAFLLFPYRYWPALLVGDLGYYAYLSYACLDTWGATWAVFNLLSPAAFVAPLIYWVRERWQPIGNAAGVGALLVCTLLLSCVLAGRSILSVNLMDLPKGYVVHNGAMAARFFIGGYLGTLTIAPLVLAIYQVVKRHGWRQLYSRVADSRLVFESTCLGLPVLAFLLWFGFSSPADSQMRQLAQVAMFLPVVWLALRHGWQGAAIGGAIASCAIKLLMPGLYDEHTIQAEILVAFAISSMLLMGARIAALDRHAEQKREDVRMAFAVAQRNVYIGEMQLRMASQTLEQVRETIQAGFTMMLGRLRHLQPALDDRGYQRHAFVAQEQLHKLADSLYPVSVRERGLPTALSEGPLVRLLADAGLQYSYDVRGPLSCLSTTLRMTVYRIVCEAVADVCCKEDMSDIRVQIRCIQGHGRHAVMVRIGLKSDPVRMSYIRWDELHAYVTRTASGLGLRAIRDRAAIFEGKAKVRTYPDGRLVSALLFDPVAGGD
ncbi:MASE1 domain-containing protein [Dyella flagellata]|uniref:Sensor histidine kinase n=1 Tax=Dyella flagellata TaxID=1867833 RepID=A0ABQ5XCF9_9GAMM|nr:MASE1 domain-containing protein [Dyella flagellata]GLQ89396.1 sensor histidine kinase [Dyella flagellata]